MEGCPASRQAIGAGIALAFTRIDAGRATCARSARRARVDVGVVRQPCGVERCDANRRPAIPTGAAAVRAASETERRPRLAGTANAADTGDDAVEFVGDRGHDC